MDSSQTAERQIRMPSEERLTEISQDSNYEYNELREELTLWQRFIIWLQRILGNWITSDGMVLFLKITGTLLFILILVLLINQIMKGELGTAIRNRHDRPVLNLQGNAKLYDDRKLHKLLEEAISNNNYHLAVRYIYQIALWKLRDRELINWASDKTNYDYLYELAGHPAEGYFDRLTYFYEYVDYGDFKIDKQQFSTIQKVFEQFKGSVEAKA